MGRIRLPACGLAGIGRTASITRSAARDAAIGCCTRCRVPTVMGLLHVPSLALRHRNSNPSVQNALFENCIRSGLPARGTILQRSQQTHGDVARDVPSASKSMNLKSQH